MRQKSKTYPIHTNIDGMAVTDSVISYLTVQFPDAEIETRYENNIYAISFVQNANLKKTQNVTQAHSKIMCYLISIQLMSGLCKIDIQSESFMLNRRSSKDRIIDAALCAGTVGAIFAFPGIAPYVMTGFAGAGIVAAANSTERKIFNFIKNYIS